MGGWTPVQEPAAGWTPVNQTPDLTAQNAKIDQMQKDNSVSLGDVGHAASEFAGDLWNTGKGLASMFRPPETKTETAVSALGPPALPIKRMAGAYFDAVQHHIDAAREAAGKGDTLGTVMHSVSAGLPLVGPLIGDVYDQANSGDIAGAVGKGASRILQAASMAPEDSAIPNPAKIVAGKVGALGEIPGKAGNVIADSLNASAAKSLEQVLGATTQKLKAAASEHVVPGMMERGMIGMSRDSILKQANQIVAENGPKVGAAIDAATKAGTEFPTKPIIDQIEALRESHQVKDAQGNVTATRPAAMNMIDNLQETLEKYNGSINPSELQALRQFWDTDVANSTKGFLLDQPAEGLQVKRAGTNLLRGTLNDNLPDLAAANKEYSFGKDLQTVLEATQQRTASQSGILGKTLRRGTGATVGGTIGGVVAGPAGAAVGAGVGGGLATLMDTTAWKTASAALKVKIANAISSGDFSGARNMAPDELKETLPHPDDSAEAARQLSAIHEIANGMATPQQIHMFFDETGLGRSDFARAGIPYTPKKEGQ